MLQFLKLTFIVLTSFLLVGCSWKINHYYSGTISTKTLPSVASLKLTPQQKVTGKGSTFQEAVENAIENGHKRGLKGNALVNVKTYIKTYITTDFFATGYLVTVGSDETVLNPSFEIETDKEQYKF